MITLVGVGHVFDLGRSIRAEILARRPRVVALELDGARFAALIERARRGGRPGLFGVLSHFQSRIASEYGVQVGDEMVAAARAAQEVGGEVALIDRDAREVIVRAWRQMPFRERVRLVLSIAGSLFVRRRTVEAELARYHEDQAAVMREFTEELPTVKRILIDERDEHMARALVELHRTKGDVVAVVGDGHIDGLVQRLSPEPVQIVRLKELMRTPGEGTASSTLSFQL